MSGSAASAGEPDTLLHATGELVGEVVLVPRESDQVHHILGAVAPPTLVLAAHLETEGDVVDHLAVGQQPEVLEDHRDLAAPGVEQRLVTHRGDVLAVQLHSAGRRLDEPGEEAHECGLAGARETHHHEDLAGSDVEADVADADHVPGLLLQLLARQLGVGALHDRVGLGAEDLPEAVDVHRSLVRAQLGRGGGLGRGRHSGSSWLRLSPGG